MPKSTLPMMLALCGALTACGAERESKAPKAPATEVARTGLPASAGGDVPPSAPGTAVASAPGTEAAPPVGGPPPDPSLGGGVPATAPAFAVGGRAAAVAGETGPEPITVAPGGAFTIRLHGNVTTGYVWRVRAPLDPHLQLGDEGYATDAPPNPNGPPLVGAGGMASFTFKAVSAGEATLTLEHARPWEKGPAADTRTWTVTIK